MRFVVSWNFPNCENYWNEEACESARKNAVPCTWKNYYATLWADARASASYALCNWSRLREETLLFKELLFASHLPGPALEAVSANLAVLKSPTVMRLEDGARLDLQVHFPKTDARFLQPVSRVLFER